jgi:hypothetical protein
MNTKHLVLALSLGVAPLLQMSCGGDTSTSDPGPGSGGSSDASAENAGAAGVSAGGKAGAGGGSGAGGSAGTSGHGGGDPVGGAAGSSGDGGAAGAGEGGTAGTAGEGGTAGTAGAAGSAGQAGSAGGSDDAGLEGGQGGGGGKDAGLEGGPGGGGGKDAGLEGGKGGGGGKDAGLEGGPGGSGGKDAGMGGSAGSVDAGADAAASCASNTDCLPSEFCSMAACGDAKGICAARPLKCDSYGTTVCGCDGVNYWNDCLRQQNGQAASVAGECKTPKTCGGIASIQCPYTIAVCAYQFDQQSECAMMDPMGQCWVLPDTCPTIVIGGQLRQCNSSTLKCFDSCTAMKTGGTYYTDTTCPI